jgi:hypothetical protein
MGERGFTPTGFCLQMGDGKWFFGSKHEPTTI